MKYPLRPIFFCPTPPQPLRPSRSKAYITDLLPCYVKINCVLDGFFYACPCNRAAYQHSLVHFRVQSLHLNPNRFIFIKSFKMSQTYVWDTDTSRILRKITFNKVNNFRPFKVLLHIFQQRFFSGDSSSTHSLCTPLVGHDVIFFCHSIPSILKLAKLYGRLTRSVIFS